MIRLGDFEVKPTGEVRSVASETTTGTRSRGHAVMYRVTGPGSIRLDVGDVRWETGERDIRVLGRELSPPRFDRLRRGLRLGVHRANNRLFVELGQARLKAEEWSNVYQASMDELDAGADVDVHAVLERLGAECTDTRGRALLDRTNRKNWMCTVFRDEDTLVPVAAYVLTRIAPLARGLGV